MNKKETLKRLNAKIDKLIIDNKTHTAEYKRLCKMHYAILVDMGIIK